MDKELLRIVIISVGILVVLGMVLWGTIKGKSKRKKINFYDNHDPLENIDPNLIVGADNDDFDIVPLTNRDTASYHDEASQIKTRLNPEYTQEAIKKNTAHQPTVTAVVPEEEKRVLPALIQLNIVAKTATGFSGAQLLDAFDRVGLIFGSVQVFERLDEQKRVDYAVASMQEPGIFPKENWGTYHCSGISFFMQPREVDNAPVVFAEMIDTLGQLASLLDGEVLDKNKELLTESALQKITASLR